MYVNTQSGWGGIDIVSQNLRKTQTVPPPAVERPLSHPQAELDSFQEDNQPLLCGGGAPWGHFHVLSLLPWRGMDVLPTTVGQI